MSYLTDYIAFVSCKISPSNCKLSPLLLFCKIVVYLKISPKSEEENMKRLLLYVPHTRSNFFKLSLSTVSRAPVMPKKLRSAFDHVSFSLLRFISKMAHFHPVYVLLTCHSFRKAHSWTLKQLKFPGVKEVMAVWRFFDFLQTSLLVRLEETAEMVDT